MYIYIYIYINIYMYIYIYIYKDFPMKCMTFSGAALSQQRSRRLFLMITSFRGKCNQKKKSHWL